MKRIWIIGVLLSLVIACVACADMPTRILDDREVERLNSKLYSAGRWGGDTYELRSLLNKGAEVNARGEDGNTALMEAAGRGHTKVVQFLIERGADAALSG